MFMVRRQLSFITACLNLELEQVISSVIAAWADIGDTFTAGDLAVLEGESWATTVTGVVSKINVGYFWMLVNCLTSAAYVSTSVMLQDVDGTTHAPMDRCCQCASESKLLGSQIGTQCSTIISYRSLCLRSSR